MDQLRELADLPARTQSKIDDICEAFEASWQNGESPTVEETVGNFDGTLRTVLAGELQRIESHYRSLRDSHDGTDCKAKLFEHFPSEFGRYHVLKTLGSGGMGCVFLAEDTKLERRVALKLPHLHADPNSQTVARFYQEARAAATIHHPNLCAVYDVGEVQGRHYLSMEYIEGETLSSRIRVADPMPELEIARYLEKLASALQEAHENGVVHRDLKPSNVMVNHRGEPIVTDFGLAQRNEKNHPKLTHSGAILGTPSYMSPEQVDGALDKVGPATDIYSLGTILYEMLSGQAPFRGSTASVLGQIMMNDPTPIAQWRRDVDPALAAICRKMMAKPIEDRFASMQEVNETISDWLHSKSRSVHPQRRNVNPSVVSGLALGLTAVLVLGIVLLIRAPQATFRVEVNDPRVRVVVDGQTLQLTDGTWEGKQLIGEHRLALAIGQRRLPLDEATVVELDGEAQTVRVSIDGINLSSDRFNIERNGETIVSIGIVLEETVVTEFDETSAADLLASGDWYWRVDDDLGPTINTLAVEQSGDITADGLTIVFARSNEDWTTGYRLWTATRRSRDARWAEAAQLDQRINSDGSVSTPMLSDDGLTLWFSCKTGTSVSTRSSLADPWSDPVPCLTFNRQHLSQVEVSSDRLTLIGTKNTGPDGGRDLFIARRSSTEVEWPVATPVGASINTDSWEDFGTLSSDGRLLVFQRLELVEDGPNRKQILISTRANWESPWSTPVPIFSHPDIGDQAPRLLPDGKTLLFSDGRPKHMGFQDLRIARLVRK